jgi:hypothetical protein
MMAIREELNNFKRNEV